MATTSIGKMTPDEVERKCQYLRDLWVVQNLSFKTYTEEEIRSAKRRIAQYQYEEMQKAGYEPDYDLINEERKLLALNQND